MDYTATRRSTRPQNPATLPTPSNGPRNITIPESHWFTTTSATTPPRPNPRTRRPEFVCVRGECGFSKIRHKREKCCLITIHPRWFEKEDCKSWGGHSIFTCGKGNSNVGSAYVSYFPKDKDNKKPKHDLNDDVKKYGLDLSTLPEDGSIQTTSKGFEVSQICFSTDCVNISKAVSYVQNVFRADDFEPWHLLGNNCANNAAATIAAGLPPQKRPKCNWHCEYVHDLLLTGIALALPTDLEGNLKRMKANGCQRYVCRQKPQPAKQH